MIINSEKLNNSIIIIFLTFCIQATELKIGGTVKVSEIMLLLILPFMLFKKSDKHLLYLLAFFVLEMFISLAVTATHDIKFMPQSFLKQPYVISVARSVEIFACICLSIVAYHFFKNHPSQSRYIIHKLVYYNVYITIFFLFIFALTLVHIIPIEKSIVGYDMFRNYRLRGLYAEGGPYGLMLSFIYVLSFFLPKNIKRLLIQIFLVIVIAVPAQSKAGIMFIILFTFTRIFLYLYKHHRRLLYPVVAVCAVIFVFALTSIANMYVHEFNRIKKSVHERPGDTNLIMGRISGTYIIPNMMADNPVFGIGIGNYAIIRNNKEYRDFFPLPPREHRYSDAQGFGGLMDIILDYGLFGTTLFGLIMYSIYTQVRTLKKGALLLLAFLMLFLFGVQIYFLYPWVLLAILLAYKNNYVHEPGS
jgi:hypothetical protein